MTATQQPQQPYVHRLQTELDAGTRQAFKERILELLEQGERKFVLDLSDCAYVDSSGLGVLVSIARRIRTAGGEIVLAGLNADVVDLFERTRLDTLFAIAENAEAAVRSLA